MSWGIVQGCRGLFPAVRWAGHFLPSQCSQAATANMFFTTTTDSGINKNKNQDTGNDVSPPELSGAEDGQSSSQQSLQASIEEMLEAEESFVHGDLTDLGGIVNRNGDITSLHKTLYALDHPNMKMLRRYGERYLKAVRRDVISQVAKDRKRNERLPLGDDDLHTISLGELRSANLDTKPKTDAKTEPDAEAASSDEASRAKDAVTGSREELEQRDSEACSEERVLNPPRLQAHAIHHFNTALLNGYVNPKGRIMSRRETGLSRKEQRRLAKAIKRARAFGLMSPVEQLNVDDIMAVYSRR